MALTMVARLSNASCFEWLSAMLEESSTATMIYKKVQNFTEILEFFFTINCQDLGREYGDL